MIRSHHHAVPCALSGAEVVRLRPVSITHPEHPVNVARRKAAETPGAVFADQFENLANYRAHMDTGGGLDHVKATSVRVTACQGCCLNLVVMQQSEPGLVLVNCGAAATSHSQHMISGW